MKTLIYLLSLTCLCCLLNGRALAQTATHARTDTGKDVILYPDGTWKFAPEEAPPKGDSSYGKSASALKAYKPQRGDFTIWYDETKWQLEVRRNDDGNGHLRLLGTDGYAMVISEGLFIPIASLKKIALDNARAAAPDSRVVSEETRTVNGKEVLCLVIEGTVEQIPFTYYGYYYGGKQGTIQLITFTGQSLFAKYKKDFTDFLNGLEIQD